MTCNCVLRVPVDCLAHCFKGLSGHDVVFGLHRFDFY